MKTDNNLLILKTDMSSGHFSQSDRYKVYIFLYFNRYLTLQYYFIVFSLLK